MDSRKTEKCHPFPRPLSWRIWIAGERPFPVYLIRGDRGSALIEAGISATAEGVIRGLDGLGAAPDAIVITHPHGDHLMGLDTLRARFPGIRVLAGEGAAAFLARPAVATGIAAEDRHMASFLAKRGYPPGCDSPGHVPDLQDAEVCSEGAELDLGGVTLRFLNVRGHSPGNLAVFIPEEKALFASDCLGFHYAAGELFPVFFTGYREYMAALDRLESLRPESLGLGHHWVTGREETASAFASARSTAAGLRQRMRSDARDEAAVVAGMMKEFYRDELTLYSRENIANCCRLLYRRSLEEEKDAE